MTKVSLNGNIMPKDACMIPITSSSAMYGLNVFEGFRGYRNEKGIYILGWSQHIRRFRDSIDLLALSCEVDEEKILKTIRELLRENNVQGGFSVKVAAMGIGDSWSHDETVLYVSASESGVWWLDDKLPSLTFSDVFRIEDNSLSPRIKCGANYMNGRMPLRKAQSCGFDYPVLCDDKGIVAEGPGASLIYMKNGSYFTTRPVDSVLQSITLDYVESLLRNKGITLKRVKTLKTDLLLADSIWLVGSRVELTPVSSIEHMKKTVDWSLVKLYRESLLNIDLEWQYYL